MTISSNTSLIKVNSKNITYQNVEYTEEKIGYKKMLKITNFNIYKSGVYVKDDGTFVNSASYNVVSFNIPNNFVGFGLKDSASYLKGVVINNDDSIQKIQTSNEDWYNIENYFVTKPKQVLINAIDTETELKVYIDLFQKYSIASDNFEIVDTSNIVSANAYVKGDGTFGTVYQTYVSKIE